MLEVIFVLFLLTLITVNFGLYIWAIIHAIKDSKNHGQEPVIWGIVVFFFSFFGLSIYKFVTGKVGAGLFWLFAYPAIISVLLFISVIILGLLGMDATDYMY